MELRKNVFRPVKHINYGYRCNYQKDIDKSEETAPLQSSDNYKSLRSIFSLHNETMNIWSHLGYAIYLVYCLIDLNFWDIEPWHKLMLFIAYLGVAMMAIMSSSYHTFKD